MLALAAPAQAASTVRYVALGDSYASGVGAGSYTVRERLLPAQHQGLPRPVGRRQRPPPRTPSVACSGATTTSVTSSQLSALSCTTTLVSITVGGNDVGFANIMTTCALYGTTQCVAAVQAAEDKARAQLPGLLDNVYNAIRARAPNARVVVLGYPVFYQLGTFCVGLSATSHAKINEGINLVDDITRSRRRPARLRLRRRPLHLRRPPALQRRQVAARPELRQPRHLLPPDGRRPVRRLLPGLPHRRRLTEPRPGRYRPVTDARGDCVGPRLAFGTTTGSGSGGSMGNWAAGRSTTTRRRTGAASWTTTRRADDDGAGGAGHAGGLDEPATWITTRRRGGRRGRRRRRTMTGDARVDSAYARTSSTRAGGRT